MKRLLVYGTLREGSYNFERFQGLYKELTKVDEVVLPGYRIYDIGYYPGLNKVSNSFEKVTFDILEMGEKCYNNIVNMEKGAGYIEKFIPEYNASLFIYNYDLSGCNDCELISSGDWIKYITQKELA